MSMKVCKCGTENKRYLDDNILIAKQQFECEIWECEAGDCVFHLKSHRRNSSDQHSETIQKEKRKYNSALMHTPIGIGRVSRILSRSNTNNYKFLSIWSNYVSHSWMISIGNLCKPRTNRSYLLRNRDGEFAIKIDPVKGIYVLMYMHNIHSVNCMYSFISLEYLLHTRQAKTRQTSVHT